MNGLRVWETGQALDRSFAAAWEERLSSVPHAHFAMRLDHLAWMSGRGQQARAVLADDGARAGMLVLRRVGRGWVSGWPWRWQMLMAGPTAAPTAVGLAPEEREWLLGAGREAAGGGRLRAFLPVLEGTPRGYPAGTTLVRAIAPDDEALFASLDGDRRRVVRKVEREGWRVREGASAEDFRAFFRLQRLVEARRSGANGVPEEVEDSPAPGASWREWELPWQWLLVAERDGIIHAGSGYGRLPGASVDYRANASDEVARRARVNLAIGIEALRRAREFRATWMNWGGSTMFKRQLGGEPVSIECVLDGGVLWSVPNQLETVVGRTRPRVSGWVGEMRRARARRSSGSDPSAVTWSTRGDAPEGFAQAWDKRLARSPLANFSMRLDYVRWEARQGRHATLVLVEHGARRGAIVLRESGQGYVSGWPWRWQATLEQPEPGHEPGVSSADAQWLFDRAERHAGGRRLRLYLPAHPLRGTAAFASGATIVQSLRASDAELLAAMDPNKRRQHRRAAAAGYVVERAIDPATALEFARVQHEAAQLREGGLAPDVDAAPPEGQGFREWELPWMWLLVARQDGRVVAGVGDGVATAAMVDGRAAAAAPEARRAGVMALLCHEEARQLRDLGHDWLNHGGDTVFKREVAGQLGRRLVIWCWLGGGRAWQLPNRTEAWARNARPRVAAWVRAVGVRGSKKGKTA